MGAFGEFLDFIKTIKNDDGIKRITNSLGKDSLQRKSLQGTLQFPHIIARNMDLETAQMVCKASERNLSTFVQISMSMNATMDIEDGTNVSDYIKRFHTNIDDYAGFGGLSKSINMIVEEGYNGFIEEDYGYLLVSTTLNDVTQEVLVSNKDQLRDVLAEMNTTILNNTTKDIRVIRESKRLTNNDEYLTEAKKSKGVASSQYTDWREKDHELKVQQFNVDQKNRAEDMKQKKEELTFRRGQEYSKDLANKREFEYKKERDIINDKNKRDLEMLKISAANPLNKGMLQDNDAKKANELVATLVHVRIQMISKKSGTTLGYQDFVLGVKATMHLVSQEEMIENLVAAYRGSNAVFDFIRWTSGEIAFFKDFLLGVSKIKADVVRRTAGQSPLWMSLKRMTAFSKIGGAFSKRGIYPNATIVLTKETVDYIKDTYNIDFMSERAVTLITDKLFLISFVVVDIAAKVCHFKYEASKNWESVSFSGLEKENSRDERKFKEMLKALNR